MGSNERKRRKFIRQLIAWGLVFAVLGGLFLYAKGLYEQGRRTYGTFHNPDGSRSVQFSLEIAATDAERAKGLMFRKSMGGSEGMIFAYPAEGNQSFWMKNTYISLDMIFLDPGFKVVGMLHDVPVLNTESRTIGKPSQYVVELNAGSAVKNKIREGSVLKFDGVVPKAKDREN